MGLCVCVCVCARTSHGLVSHDPHLTPTPEQHECGFLVGVLRLWLCNRTTALRDMAGSGVAVEPGSEIKRGHANVEDPAVPDRFVLCNLWRLKLFFFLSVFVKFY